MCGVCARVCVFFIGVWVPIVCCLFGCLVRHWLGARRCGYAADAVPLLPIYWCSFRRPRKDDKLSQPPGVNSVANGTQTQDPRIPSHHPKRKANTRLRVCVRVCVFSFHPLSLSYFFFFFVDGGVNLANVFCKIHLAMPGWL